MGEMIVWDGKTDPDYEHLAKVNADDTEADRDVVGRELRSLQARVDDKEQEIKDISMNIIAMDLELQKMAPDLVKEYNELQEAAMFSARLQRDSELEEALRRAKQRCDEDEESESEEPLQLPAPGAEPSEEQLQMNREMRRKAERELKNASRKVDMLFKRIAKLTHPDKTRGKPEKERERLTGIFRRAKVAKMARDFKELERLYIDASTTGAARLSALIERYKMLSEHYTGLLDQLRSIKSQPNYSMMIDWRSGRPEFQKHVLDHFKRLLQAKINAFKAELGL